MKFTADEDEKLCRFLGIPVRKNKRDFGYYPPMPNILSAPTPATEQICVEALLKIDGIERVQISYEIDSAHCDFTDKYDDCVKGFWGLVGPRDGVIAIAAEKLRKDSK